MENKKKSNKELALETLNAVKKLYDQSESSILVAGFWTEFMALVNGQIKEIEETMV